MNPLGGGFLLLSGLGLFLSSWIVIPAPTFMLLPLGVGTPEISPLLLLANGTLLILASFLRDGTLRSIVISLSSCAIVLSSLPLLQVPATLQRATTEMQAALGTDYLTGIPTTQRSRMRSYPLVLTDLVTGLLIPEVQRDRQSFTALDGTPLDLEIVRPLSAGPHPALVTLYGGAWQRGELGQNAAFESYIAAQGYTVVAIDYRHAPQFRFPTQFEDVKTALQWVKQNATHYDIDHNRVALMGWSAGAHLALLAAYQTTILPIRAVVNYYGPTNLTAGYQEPPIPDPIHTRSVLEALLGGSPNQLPEAYQIASPIYHVKPGLPPTLLVYGDRDHLVKPIFGKQLYNRLKAHQNTAVLVSLPWSEHAFDAVFRGLGNQIALYYTKRFLA